MIEPTLSVIISVHNCEDYIGECLDSLFKQTQQAAEIIIVLDASTDGTSEVVETWTDKLPLTVLRNKSRMGKPWSLNRAIDAASGEFIAQVDADDISHPKRFQLQLCFMKRHSDIDVCGTWGHRFGAATYPLKRPAHNVSMRWWLMLGENPVLHTSVFYRRASLERHALRYDPEFQFCQDHEFFLRLAFNGFRFANLSRDLVGWRAHSDNTVHVKNSSRLSAYREQIINNTFSGMGIKASPEEVEVHRWLSAMRLPERTGENISRLNAWCRRLCAVSFSKQSLSPSVWVLTNIAARWAFILIRR